MRALTIAVAVAAIALLSCAPAWTGLSGPNHMTHRSGQTSSAQQERLPGITLSPIAVQPLTTPSGSSRSRPILVRRS